MKNAIFAALIVGFVMTSVSFADPATTTTTGNAAPAKTDTTAPVAADAGADHMAAAKSKTTTHKVKHNADGSKETTHKETTKKDAAAE